MTISIVLYIIAFIAFIVEAWRTHSLTAVGLALFALGHCLVGAPAFGKP